MNATSTSDDDDNQNNNNQDNNNQNTLLETWLQTGRTTSSSAPTSRSDAAGSVHDLVQSLSLGGTSRTRQSQGKAPLQTPLQLPTPLQGLEACHQKVQHVRQLCLDRTRFDDAVALRHIQWHVILRWIQWQHLSFSTTTKAVVASSTTSTSSTTTTTTKAADKLVREIISILSLAAFRLPPHASFATFFYETLGLVVPTKTTTKEKMMKMNMTKTTTSTTSTTHNKKNKKKKNTNPSPPTQSTTKSSPSPSRPSASSLSITCPDSIVQRLLDHFELPHPNHTVSDPSPPPCSPLPPVRVTKTAKKQRYQRNQQVSSSSFSNPTISNTITTTTNQKPPPLFTNKENQGSSLLLQRHRLVTNHFHNNRSTALFAHVNLVTKPSHPPPPSKSFKRRSLPPQCHGHGHGHSSPSQKKPRHHQQPSIQCVPMTPVSQQQPQRQPTLDFVLETPLPSVTTTTTTTTTDRPRHRVIVQETPP